MAMYQRGETVICSLAVRKSGALYNPLTSTQITITDGRGTTLVNLAAMTNDGVGLYHYDFGSTTSHFAGRYRARYKTVNAGRITIMDDWFELEDGAG